MSLGLKGVTNMPLLNLSVPPFPLDFLTLPFYLVYVHMCRKKILLHRESCYSLGC